MNTVGSILLQAVREWGWLSYVLSSPQEITADLATPCAAHKYLLLHPGMDTLNRIAQICCHLPTSFHLTSGS